MNYKSGLPPLCRYCGVKIAKRSSWVYVYAEPPRDHTMEPIYETKDFTRVLVGHRKASIHVPKHIVGQPKTKGELEPFLKLVSNAPVSVLAIRKKDDGTIDQFSIWDRETYVDKFFCTGECARRFGYLMAKGGHCTAAYNKAIEKLKA